MKYSLNIKTTKPVTNKLYDTHLKCGYLPHFLLLSSKLDIILNSMRRAVGIFSSSIGKPNSLDNTFKEIK